MLPHAPEIACRAKPLVIVMGATGTGKSQLAVDIAVRFNGEIINADAMQMYTGLPIVTNKPTAAERRSVRHHLLDVVKPEDSAWTVGKFLQEARLHIDRLHAEGRVPILVGGTHYYLQSFLFGGTVKAAEQGIELGGTDPDHFQPLLDAATPVLYAELQRLDPEIAKRWHPNDHRKIRRSLEIYYQTGRKASEIYSDQRKDLGERSGDYSHSQEGVYGQLVYDPIFLWTHTERESLIRRLDDRIDCMVTNGLLDEVAQLDRVRIASETRIPLDLSKGVWISIGYKEFQTYTHAVRIGATPKQLEELFRGAIERTKIATRQYAKSQVKWIRNKLLTALRKTDAVNCVHVIDTGDPNRWYENVAEPVSDLVRCYLRNLPVPKTFQTAEVAKEMLQVHRGTDLSSRPDLWVSKHCELCSVTAITETQWQAHVQGRTHRTAVKKQNRRPHVVTESHPNTAE